MAVGTGVPLLPLHTPVEVAEQMATLDAFATGVDRLVLRTMWPGLPREDAVRSIERVGDGVIPNV